MSGLHVALVNWFSGDKIASSIQHELVSLGHIVSPFHHEAAIPHGADVVFTYAPYGPLYPLLHRAAQPTSGRRPVIAHWNTEGMPDLRIPAPVMEALAGWRAAHGRQALDVDSPVRGVLQSPPLAWVNRRFSRFRYLGDYLHSYRQGWLDVYADISAVYAQLLEGFGLPVCLAPYGAAPDWGEPLGLERDIDVLWLGNYATVRRRRILRAVRAELEAAGAAVYFADNEENPFVFGAERTELLNRTKVVLNVTRTWYDDNTLRMAIAARNRAVVVSEPLLDHCPPLIAGRHYIDADIDQLAVTIRRTLRDDSARQAIAENAYQLYTRELTLHRSIATIMDQVTAVFRARSRAHAN